MPIPVEMLADEPILLATFNEPFVPEVDMPPMLADIKRLRELAQQQVSIILDVSAVDIDFTKLVMALAQAGEQIRAQQRVGAALPDEYVFVGSSALIQLAAEAMGQDQYGGIGGAMFASLEDALSYVRTRITSRPEM